MDTFIDKLAQRKNAQEMIRANSAAEAAKMDQMQKQLQAYDEIMQEIRRVNLKTAQNVDSMRSLIAKCIEKLESVQVEDKTGEDVEKQLTAVRCLLEDRLAQTEDIVHKENVKVYRNVQAAFTEELEKQNRLEQESQGTKGKKPSTILVAILIGVIVDIIVNLIPLM